MDSSNAKQTPDQWWYVYILKCSDSTLYTGCSPDVEKRLAKHNKGKGARYTSTRRPSVLVYKVLAGSHGSALKLEREIKKLSRKQKLKLCGGAYGRHRNP